MGLSIWKIQWIARDVWKNPIIKCLEIFTIIEKPTLVSLQSLKIANQIHVNSSQADGLNWIGYNKLELDWGEKSWIEKLYFSLDWIELELNFYSAKLKWQQNSFTRKRNPSLIQFHDISITKFASITLQHCSFRRSSFAFQLWTTWTLIELS